MLLDKHLNISTMQMYYFIEVANCESFTLAAQQLYTTPSTLNKAVSAIENELDARLFVRNKKRLYITEAGQYLCERWKRALTDIENSVLECRTMAGGAQSAMVIGGLDTHRLNQILFPKLREYIARYPDAKYIVETCQAQDIRKRLISGDFDIVYTVLYDIEQLGAAEIEYRIVEESAHNVCMLPDNPLAQKEKISMKDLEEMDFLCISPMYTPSYRGMLLELCGTAGFVPRMSRFVPSAHSLPFNLANKNEIFICDKFYSNTPKEGVVLRPIENTKSGVVAACRRNNENPDVRRFMAMLE